MRTDPRFAGTGLVRLSGTFRRSGNDRSLVSTIDVEELLYLSAMACAASLALAHFSSWSQSRFLLAMTFVSWVVVAIFAFLRVAARAVRSVRATTDPSLVAVWVLSAVSVVFGLGREIQLGLLQTLGGLTDLSYNIDHRFILMHAWSILRGEGLSQTLSMVGQPVAYHTGPAWYAAAVASLADAPVQTVLFLWFPFAALVTIFIATLRILRAAGIPSSAAVVGVAFATVPTWSHMRLSRLTDKLSDAVDAALVGWSGGVIRNIGAGVLQPLPTQMLNALLGTALILAAVAYYAKAGSNAHLALAGLATGLAMLAKPQYVASGPVILLALALVRHRRGVGRSWMTILVPALAAGGGLILTSVAFDSTGLFEGNVRSLRLAMPSDWRAVRPFLPTTPAILLVVVVVIMVVWSRASGELEAARARAAAVLVTITLSMIAFWLLLSGVVGAGGDEVWAWGAMTGLGPSTWMATALAASLVASNALADHRWKPGVVLIVAVIGLGALSASSQVVNQVRDPMSGHEALDASEIRTLLARVDPRSAVVVTSDLSDTAQGHKRSGRAFYLSNRYGHQFWLTQTEYGHQRLKETESRRKDLERFFASPWSRWHVAFLEDNAITHIIANERCPAIWAAEPPPLLSLVQSTENWQAWEVSPPSQLWYEGLLAVGPLEGHVEDQSPEFGRASCR